AQLLRGVFRAKSRSTRTCVAAVRRHALGARGDLTAEHAARQPRTGARFKPLPERRSRGGLQCDGTSLTSFLERVGGKRPGCWAHGRRRLVECARAGDALALEGLRLIRRIFAVDRLSALRRETA